jgi:hypothetical protein
MPKPHTTLPLDELRNVAITHVARTHHDAEKLYVTVELDRTVDARFHRRPHNPNVYITYTHRDARNRQSCDIVCLAGHE